MAELRFHHVGIATRDIGHTLDYLRGHFAVAEVSESVYDPNQDATLCMVTMEDGYRLELISGEVVKTFLKKKQNLYHICYSVPDIEAAMAEFAQDSFVLGEAKEAVLFGGKRVVFIMTEMGLIELVEE